jgi:hypothetical protein
MTTSLRPGDVCWFASTPKGNEIADGLLRAGYQSVPDDD